MVVNKYITKTQHLKCLHEIDFSDMMQKGGITLRQLPPFCYKIRMNLHVHAAAAMYNLTCYIRREVGGQEYAHIGHILGGAATA